MEPLDLCVRPHLCFECKQRFWTKVDLEKHMNFIHGTRPSFVCIDCKRGFWTKIELEKHMDFMHGTRSSVITKSSNFTQVSNFPSVQFYQEPIQQSKTSSDLSGSDLVQVTDNKISSPRCILNTLKSKRQKPLKSKRQKPYWPCSFFNTALNQISQNSSDSSHKTLVQVAGNGPSNILYTEAVGTNQITKTSPHNQEPNQLFHNLKNSLKSESVEMPDNATSNTKKVLQHLKYEETRNVNLPSFHVVCNKETNQNSQNSSDSLHTRLTQEPNKAASTTEIILHSDIVEANLIPKIPSTPLNEEQNEQLQNLKDSLEPKLVEVPDNTTSSTKEILQFKETLNISLPSFNEAFNEETNQHSQNSGDSLHTGLVQMPDKASENNLQSDIAGSIQIPKTPNTPLNEEPNQLLQNLKDSLQPVSVEVPDNTTSSTKKFLRHLEFEGTININLPSFNEVFYKEINAHSQTSSGSLNTGLAEVPNKAASVSENILQNVNAGTNQIFRSPRAPLGQPMNVDESQKPYSQNNPFSKRLNQLEQKFCVSINPRIAEGPGNATSIKENIFPSVNVDESENPFAQSAVSQNASVSSPRISQEIKNATSTLANTLQSRTVKTNKTSHSQSALFNQRPNQQDSSDSISLHSGSVHKSKNPTTHPRKILPSLHVGDNHNLYSPTVPYNQGLNQLSENPLLYSESVQTPYNKRIVEGNQIAYLPSIPFYQGPVQMLQNSNGSLIVTDTGLVQVQDNKRKFRANNSSSWVVGNSPNISPQCNLFNQMPFQLLHNLNNSTLPNFVLGPDPSTTSKKKRVTKKRKVKPAENNQNQQHDKK